MGSSGFSQCQHQFQRRLVPQGTLLIGERQVGIQQIQVDPRAAGFLDGLIGWVHDATMGR